MDTLVTFALAAILLYALFGGKERENMSDDLRRSRWEALMGRGRRR